MSAPAKFVVQITKRNNGKLRVSFSVSGKTSPRVDISTLEEITKVARAAVTGVSEKPHGKTYTEWLAARASEAAASASYVSATASERTARATEAASSAARSLSSAGAAEVQSTLPGTAP